MNDTTITTLLLFGATITLVGIGIQLFSIRKTPESSAKLHSIPVKTNKLILMLLIFSIGIALILFAIEASSFESLLIETADRFEGDPRENTK